MNHTHLWKDTDQQEDDEKIGDDILATPTDSSEVRNKGSNKNARIRTKNGGGGSWLLRQSIGKGPSLGEKIGESVERAAYKAVTGAGKLVPLLSRRNQLGFSYLFVQSCRLSLEVFRVYMGSTC